MLISLTEVMYSVPVRSSYYVALRIQYRPTHVYKHAPHTTFAVLCPVAMQWEAFQASTAQRVQRAAAVTGPSARLRKQR